MKSNNFDFDHLLKAIFLGDSKTGKTYIFDHLHNPEPKCCLYKPTVGVEFKYVFNDNIKFQLWDMAGTTKYRSIINAYSRGAAIVFFVIHKKTTKNDLDYINTILKDESLQHNIEFLLLVNNKDPDISIENSGDENSPEDNFSKVCHLLSATDDHIVYFNSDEIQCASINAINDKLTTLGKNFITKEYNDEPDIHYETVSHTTINKKRIALTLVSGIGILFALGWAAHAYATNQSRTKKGYFSYLKDFYITTQEQTIAYYKGTKAIYLSPIPDYLSQIPETTTRPPIAYRATPQQTNTTTPVITHQKAPSFP